MAEEKSPLEELRKSLTYKKVNSWNMTNSDRIMSFADEYKKVLNQGKTEREFSKLAEDFLATKGFQKFGNPYNGQRMNLMGTKIFRTIKGKGVIAFIGGKRPISDGINFVASHIDSPRLDLKQNPLYEDSGFAFLDTHYYGGIKTYQWMNIPLSIHGKIVRKDGSEINISIGESAYDPVFVISDILPHLARDYKTKPVGDVFKNEALDVMIGSLPIDFNEEEKDGVKFNILKILHDKYGMIEEDFLSAELEIVPKGEALDLGFDRSMILAYGHDDRICAYTSLRALVDMEEIPELSACVLLLDKEEIGSEGNTGAQTHAIEEMMEDLIEISGEKLSVTKLFSRCNCLSADVGAAFDPHFKDVFEEKNTPHFHKGIVITKFTGSGGKGGSSDASAEFTGKIRKLFTDNQVIFQTGELGKVDVGGGGTVAKYFGQRGMEVIDAGTALLSMHAPYEICAKDDLYETYRAYLVFLKKFI